MLIRMSPDAKWILGTLVGAVVAMTGVFVSVVAILIGGVNARIAGLETDLRRMDDRLRAVEITLGELDQRLGAVEATLGEVDQRLETLERAILPAPPAD